MTTGEIRWKKNNKNEQKINPKLLGYGKRSEWRTAIYKYNVKITKKKKHSRRNYPKILIEQSQQSRDKSLGRASSV